MAGSVAAVLDSLKQTRLGAGDGEGGLQAPFNAATDMVLVKCRNLSATMKRRVVIEAISWYSGGEQYAMEQQEKGKTIHLELLRQQAAKRDVSPFEDKILAVDVMLKFNNGNYVVPHTGADGEVGPWTDLPDGLYDLYMGNYQRLHNPMELAAEMERVKSRRKDICIRERNTNPWAFLEWSYEIKRPLPTAIDTERVFSGDLMEV